jgi:multiple sugar transport system permease protein
VHGASPVKHVLSYAALIGFAVFALFPLVWMIDTAFKPQVETFTFPPVWIPHPPTLANFKTLFTQVPISQFMVNSILMTVFVVGGQLIFGVPAAYAFARMKFYGRNILFMVFLTSLMIPPIVVMIPLFIMLREVGWISTRPGLIIPQIFSFGIPTLVVFFLRQFFLSLPYELEEAARLDGASLLRTLWSIILPNSGAAITTVAAIGIVSIWNTLLWPLLETSTPSQYVLTVAMGTLIGEYRTADWGEVMAGAAVVLLPMLLVFFVAQRQFMRSIAITGIK